MFIELARPFSYLSIEHESNLPRIVNWVIPLCFSATSIALVLLFGIEINIFGNEGFVSRTLGFVQNLPGFYIAALAAIATFSSNSMDLPMPGIPPKMSIIYNGKRSVVSLTRRRFLSSLFAYLTAISFLIVILSLVCLSLANPLSLILPSKAVGVIKVLTISSYLIILYQMISITFWGIYYLGERIHTPDV